MSMSSGQTHLPPPEHVDSRGLQESAKHDHRKHFAQRGHRPRSRSIWRALTWPIRLVLRAVTWPLRRTLHAWLD